MVLHNLVSSLVTLLMKSGSQVKAVLSISWRFCENPLILLPFTHRLSQTLPPYFPSTSLVCRKYLNNLDSADACRGDKLKIDKAGGYCDIWLVIAVTVY